MTELLDLSGANPWRTRSSRVVFDNGRLRLCEDDVLQPDGAQGTYAYLATPWPVVAIVPISDDAHVYLVRQWRYPWQRNSWEIPAGHCELGEPPLHGAQRELAEEVGLEAATWDPLGTGFSSATVSTRYHVFLARELSPVSGEHQRDGTEQDMIARRVPLVQAVEAAMDGRIEGSLSVVGLLRAARRLGV
ncbi:MAG: NUDIX domain-containing protein [Chloroflexota bacterium]